MENESKYIEVNGTSYQKGTPKAVIDVLENARTSRTRIKLYYGDHETGRDWNETYDTVGTIGRSTGSIKVPLLIRLSKSTGGGAISTSSIVKIKDVKSGKVLYQASNYKQPKVEITSSDMQDKGYTHNVMVDGEVYGRHKSLKSAQILQSKIMAKGSTIKGGVLGDTVADRYARLTKTEGKRLDELSKKVRINEQTESEDIEWDKLVHKYRGWEYKHAKGSTVNGGLFTIEKGVKLKRGDKLEFTDEKIHPLTYIEKEGQMAYTRHSSHPTKKDAERVSEGLSKNFYNVIVPSKGEYVVYKNLFNTFKNGSTIEGGVDSLKDFVINFNKLAYEERLQSLSKGELMKIAYGESYKNVDSALPQGLLEEEGISNDEYWHYVMDYNNNGAFGRLTDLFDKIYEKNPTIQVYNDMYNVTDTLPIMSAVEKYKDKDIMWQIKRGEDTFAKGGNTSNEWCYEIGGL